MKETCIAIFSALSFLILPHARAEASIANRSKEVKVVAKNHGKIGVQNLN